MLFIPCAAGLSGLNGWTVPEFPVWTGLKKAPMQMGLVLVLVLVLVLFRQVTFDSGHDSRRTKRLLACGPAEVAPPTYGHCLL